MTSTTKTYDEVVLGRRSIRGFKREPLPKDVIKDVIAMAMRAPSSLNTQPWNFYVVSGEPLDRIRAGNTERNLAGVPDSREFRGHGGYEGPHRERQIEIAKQLFGAMGIARDDKPARQDWVLRGFRQFDAPVSVVVTYDRSIHGGDIAPFDCGAVTNALVTRWVQDGTAETVLAAVRDESIARHELAQKHLGRYGIAAQPEGFHVWLPLSSGWSPVEFASYQRLQGVGQRPGQGLGGLVEQVGAVEEGLLEALIEHGHGV